MVAASCLAVTKMSALPFRARRAERMRSAPGNQVNAISVAPSAKTWNAGVCSRQCGALAKAKAASSSQRPTAMAS
jgi:hypothetical protein